MRKDFQAYYAQGEDFRKKISLEGADTSKFKDGVDPAIVLKMLTMCAERFSGTHNFSEQDIDSFHQDFIAIVNMLRNNFYREECL